VIGEDGIAGLYPGRHARMDLMRRRVLLAALVAAAAACAPATNYPDPTGPRLAGTFAGQPAEPVVKVVSFNVKFARRIDALVQLLRYEPRLAGADVIALQEMDGAGTECAARTLGLNYVYYPAALHPQGGKDFGNAILSPWPIENDRKLILPGKSRLRAMQRIAVGADVLVRGLRVRTYSVHLETPAGLSGRDRRAQARVVLEDAGAAPHVLVAGDFNGRSVVGDVFPPAGYLWATQGVGRTISLFSWDHVLARGFRVAGCGGVGSVGDNWGASDHRPVWAELVPTAP
jgi:endonuclease/exonuclease/phosphatase family metal-dependent hydrolase